MKNIKSFYVSNKTNKMYNLNTTFDLRFVQNYNNLILIKSFTNLNNKNPQTICKKYINA